MLRPGFLSVSRLESSAPATLADVLGAYFPVFVRAYAAIIPLIINYTICKYAREIASTDLCGRSSEHDFFRSFGQTGRNIAELRRIKFCCIDKIASGIFFFFFFSNARYELPIVSRAMHFSTVSHTCARPFLLT